MSHLWFVATFARGHEEHAARSIDGPDGRGFCPLEVRNWVSRGVRRSSRLPVIPGYVFVEMERGDPHRWHDVAGCEGFFGFIGGGDPEPVLDGRVDDMLVRVGDDWVMDLGIVQQESCSLRRGDRVRVVDGVLSNLEGHVEWIRCDARYGWIASCSLRGLFAGDVRAELPVNLLERVTKRQETRRTLLDLPVLRQVSIA